MKIKRFVAKDIRQAMRMVKEELGADAVIMSNRSVEDGVEIVAAKDFDDQAVENSLKSQNNLVGSEHSVKRRVELDHFNTEPDNLHVVRSARKLGSEPVQPKKILNRGIDKYIGYAEKVDLIAKKSTPEVKRQSKPVIKQSKTIAQQFSPSVREEIKQQSAMPAHFMQEMRNEIQSLKTALDSKLSEASWGGHREQENPVRFEMLHRLSNMGFSKKLSTKIANRLDSHKDICFAFEKAKQMLEKVLPIAEDNLLEQGGVVALVGPTGVGKTTTIAKLAAQFILQHGSGEVALITMDNYRIGAYEQLSTYGRLLDVPVKVAGNAEELRDHINLFNAKRLILIDTAGMSQRDMRLAEQIQTLQQQNISIKTYLVMSAATQYKSMIEIINAFKVFKPESSILTKLDETVAKGSTLSAMIESQLPISFMTNGQQVPEDIYLPNAEALIEQCDSETEQENEYNESLSYDEWMAAGYA